MNVTPNEEFPRLVEHDMDVLTWRLQAHVAPVVVIIFLRLHQDVVSDIILIGKG